MALGAFVTLGICASLGITMAAKSKNPFEGATFYVNPWHAKNFDSVENVSGKAKANLKKMQKVAIASWIDKKDKIRGNGTDTLEGVLKDASSKSPTELVLLMLYNLPNRDCAAKASDGEICCVKYKHGKCNYFKQKDHCEDGLKEYKSDFIDPIIKLLEEYEKKLPIVVVLEPDSLANLATNTGNKHCGKTTQAAYIKGVTYAVKQLTTKVPSVSIYLDGANGGWMGWTSNLDKFMLALKKMDLPWKKIRGFVTNVANYQPLGIQCPWCPDQGYRNGYCLAGKHQTDPCCDDPMNLNSQYNFANNELNYAAGLVAAAEKFLGMDAHIIIDTGRNGVARMRKSYKNWCNPRKAGAGIPSTAKTANASLTDAYFWMKIPGESDGCTMELPNGDECPRFDDMCESEDSIGYDDDDPRAPEAGTWFEEQAKLLAANARFDPPKIPKRKKLTCGTEKKNRAYNRTSEDGKKGCADVYTQCGGGKGPWSGVTCCAAGCTCEPNGIYDDQCRPPKGEYKCVVKAKTTEDEENDHDEGTGEDEEKKDEDDKDNDEDEEKKDEDDDESSADSEIAAKYSNHAPFPEITAGRALFSLPVAGAALGVGFVVIALAMFMVWGRVRARFQLNSSMANGSHQAQGLYEHLDSQMCAMVEAAP